MGPVVGQRARGLVADAAVGAGDERHPAGLVADVVGAPGGGCRGPSPGMGSRVADVVRRDGAQLPGLVVLEGLDDLVPGVHDEGPVGGDGLADGPAAEDQHVQRRVP